MCALAAAELEQGIMSTDDWTDAEAHAERARDFYEQGKWAEAAHELQAAIEVHPHNATWHFNLALTLEAMDEHEAAIASFQTSLAIDGDDLECRNCLAVNLARVGRYDEALTQHAAIDRIDPDYEPSYCNRIAVYGEIGNHQAAEEMFYRARQITDACPTCSYNIGHSLFARGQIERAVLCWEGVLDLDPAHPHANVRLADAYWRLGRLRLARKYYEHQVDLFPEDVDALLDFGDLLAESGHAKQAEARYRQVTGLSPTDPAGYAALGELALESGRWDDAETHLRTALTFDDRSARIRTKLAQTLLHRGQDEQAARHLTIALRYSGNNPKALADCAQVLMQAHRSRQAHSLLRRLVKMCPDSPVIRHNLAVACFRMRRLDEGIGHCRQAIRLRRNYPLAWYNLALAHAKQGRLTRARSCVNRALQFDPDNPPLNKLAVQLDRRRSFWSRVGRWMRRLRRRPARA